MQRAKERPVELEQGWRFAIMQSCEYEEYFPEAKRPRGVAVIMSAVEARQPTVTGKEVEMVEMLLMITS